MPGQVLMINPESEMVFRGPFDKVVTSLLKLKNPSSDTVAFKVKTTAPKRYCVRPNSGLVQPGSEIEVQVMLQPFEYDPSEKNKHKFMVQSLIVKSPAVDSLDDLWKSVDSGQLMDSKLRVLLDSGEQSSAKPTGTASATSAADDKYSNATNTSTASPASQQRQQQNEQSQSDSVKQQPQQQQSQQNPTESVKGLKSEIQKLKEENARLNEQEVRLRKLAMRDTKSSELPGQQVASKQLQATPAVPPVLFLVLALVLGLLVGKFVL